MPITLPDLKNTHCVSLTACGELKTTDQTLNKWLKKEKRVVADLKTSGEKTYVRVSLGGYSGKHFHVDITKQRHFPKKGMPASNLTLAQIQNKFEHVMGKEVVVDLTGRFEIKFTDLPESGIIKSLLFQTQLGDVGIKLKGAKLSITGAPINAITWHLFTDSKTIGVSIETENLKTTITENYLTSALATLENALNVFVLGKISQ